ncbi:FCS-Like Zinc finger 6-like [Diospyros lotus]|uniref:FCS-Like Zinc finger 6-like n=1 Tax=Diospyros lotus TaxID=55363 RepID=UPI00224FEBDF|nr:FCS-Like Zinc finger 6-like [Diospyros lotus]
MMLGKRQRGPMSRSASMAGIDVEGVEPSDHPDRGHVACGEERQGRRRSMGVGGQTEADRSPAEAVWPQNHGRISGGGSVVMEMAHFLRTCGLCQQRLAPGRDIYMYRGDTAFCSLECREKQMKQDERKEKCHSEASKKEENRQQQSAAASATPEA